MSVDAAAIVEANAHAVLSVSIALLGGLAVPVVRLLIALPHTAAHVVIVAEAALGIFVALFGGFDEPLHGSGITLFHAPAVGIAHPKVILRAIVALFGGSAIPFGGLLVFFVFHESIALVEHIFGRELRLGGRRGAVGGGLGSSDATANEERGGNKGGFEAAAQSGM